MGIVADREPAANMDATLLVSAAHLWDEILPMTLVRGVDCDNYDGAVAVSRFLHLYDAFTARFAILGLEAGMPYVDVQRRNASAAGLTVPLAYKFLYWDDNDIPHLQAACAKQLPIAPDIEYGDGMPGGFSATVERMAQAKDLLVREGLFWGWYSSVEEWARLTGNTMLFAGDRGWCANYPFSKPGQAVLPPLDYMPKLSDFAAFGGTKLTILQYADICYDEPTFDLNAMEVTMPDDRGDPTLALLRSIARKPAKDGDYVVTWGAPNAIGQQTVALGQLNDPTGAASVELAIKE